MLCSRIRGAGLLVSSLRRTAPVTRSHSSRKLFGESCKDFWIKYKRLIPAGFGLARWTVADMGVHISAANTNKPIGTFTDFWLDQSPMALRSTISAEIDDASIQNIWSQLPSRRTFTEATGPSASNYGKTHCPRGHAYTPENTYRRSKSRECRTCWAITKRNRKMRKAGLCFTPGREASE